MTAPGALAKVVRDGFVESVHFGHVAVTDEVGDVLASVGDPDASIYVRSAVKPLQTVAVLELLAEAGEGLDAYGMAIASASHAASAEHQVEAAHLLARAGLDERALQCPPDLPADPVARSAAAEPQSLAHNCSGKHAGFLLAHTVTGGDPADYLVLDSKLQQRVREVLARFTGAQPQGPGVDGCGAPAWRLPMAGLAWSFAQLAAAEDGFLGDVRAAMVALPHLVGGHRTADAVLMRAETGVVAKRGAEGVLAAGWVGPRGPRGLAVKIGDGAGRASGLVAAGVLSQMGASVPDSVRVATVLGGGQPHGHIVATPAVEACGAA